MRPVAILAHLAGKGCQAVREIVIHLRVRPYRVGHAFQSSRHPAIFCERERLFCVRHATLMPPNLFRSKCSGMHRTNKRAVSNRPFFRSGARGLRTKSGRCGKDAGWQARKLFTFAHPPKENQLKKINRHDQLDAVAQHFRRWRRQRLGALQRRQCLLVQRRNAGAGLDLRSQHLAVTVHGEMQ
jgi:hypothetical protein